MKIIFLLSVLLLLPSFIFAQWKTKDPAQFQTELNAWYKSVDTSPFKDAQSREAFRSLKYYTITDKYKITGRFHRTENGEIKTYPTSSGQPRDLQEYGYVEFEWRGEQYQLFVLEEMEKYNPEYADFVEIPFYDATNNKQTYGGGRYLGFWKDELIDGEPIILNFNLAFNPYCAYTKGYACLIPPEKNRLDFKVKAGVKKGLISE